MQDYYRLSNELTKAVRMRDGYINELQMSNSSNEVVKSIEIMRRMHVDDMETASCLMLMAREMQTKVHEKKIFIMRLSKMSPLGIGHCVDDVPVKHLLTFLLISTIVVTTFDVKGESTDAYGKPVVDSDLLRIADTI
ncbi:hypothetical protein Tco_1103421 [Tanacetum coccineum]